MNTMPKPSYEDGHLIVAAVRVLSHRAAKPPTPEEIADLLGLAPDFARNLVRALGQEGILRIVENPFEIRAELGDHLRIEDLPKESEAPTIQHELDDFMKRKQREVEETEKMLSMEEIEKRKREKLGKLDEEMKKMKGEGPAPFD
jgi:DNA-directed RNA polymerase specialized sigma subunit